jgi:hypothetical protein|tara:strand:+ start:277 stop:480 length:204 start_codon:yes stop_codon:yes gene_type:complete
MANVKIQALCTFGGHDAGRDGKLVSMGKDDVQEVSKDFAKDVIQAGHAIEYKKKAKVKHGASHNSDS